MPILAVPPIAGTPCILFWVTVAASAGAALPVRLHSIWHDLTKPAPCVSISPWLSLSESNSHVDDTVPYPGSTSACKPSQEIAMAVRHDRCYQLCIAIHRTVGLLAIPHLLRPALAANANQSVQRRHDPLLRHTRHTAFNTCRAHRHRSASFFRNTAGYTTDLATAKAVIATNQHRSHYHCVHTNQANPAFSIPPNIAR